MKYTYLGKTGFKVSRICLGTMNFGMPLATGQRTDEKEAFRIMDMALDYGINFFDTANVYGDTGPGEATGQHGRTEEIIGHWFAQGGGRREKVTLTSKVSFHMYAEKDENLDGPNNEPGMSKWKIRRHLEGSLKRLGTDHIELYQIHYYGGHENWEEIWDGFEEAQAQGKIDYVGSCNSTVGQIVRGQQEAKRRHHLGLVSEQHKYNLFTRTPELALIPAAHDLGMGVLCWSPLESGWLGNNALAPNKVSRIHVAHRERSDKLIAQLTAYKKMCDELGETPAHVALAWLIHNPMITAPLVGIATAEQMANVAHAAEIELPEDFLKQLDVIFPGPDVSDHDAFAGW